MTVYDGVCGCVRHGIPLAPSPPQASLEDFSIQVAPLQDLPSFQRTQTLSCPVPDNLLLLSKKQKKQTLKQHGKKTVWTRVKVPFERNDVITVEVATDLELDIESRRHGHPTFSELLGTSQVALASSHTRATDMVWMKDSLHGKHPRRSHLSSPFVSPLGQSFDPRLGGVCV